MSDHSHQGDQAPTRPLPAPSVLRTSRIVEMRIESSSSRARRRRPRTLVDSRPVRLRSRARSTPLVASPLLGLGVRVGGWFLTRTPGRRPSGLKRRRRCTGALRRATRAPSRLPSVGAAGGWWAALHHGGQSRRLRRRHRLRCRRRRFTAIRGPGSLTLASLNYAPPRRRVTSAPFRRRRGPP